MSAVVSDDGLQVIANHLEFEPFTVKIKLFKSDHTPATGSVIADFTEADYSGYASQDSDPVSVTWDSSAGGKAIFLFTQKTFTRGAGGTTNTIYGYFIQINDHGGTQKLLMAEKFSAPVVLDTNGQYIQITPEIDFLR